jgi:hypothetical protein
VGRRVRGLFVLATCSVVTWGAAVARGSNGPDDLDARIAEALEGVPLDRAVETIRTLVDAHLGTTGIHAVSPGSIWDHDAAEQNQVFDAVDGGFLQTGPVNWAGGCRQIPLHLRADATVTGLVTLFIDDGVGDIVVQLRRKLTASTANAEVLASAASSGASPGLRIATDLTVSNGAIDEANYAYFLWVCSPIFDLAELHGIYVTYTY